MEKHGWEKELEEMNKTLEEQIAIAEQLTQDNLKNAWATVYGPIRNLFAIAKDQLGCIDKIRAETLALREKDRVLEERVEKLKSVLEELERKVASIPR